MSIIKNELIFKTFFSFSGMFFSLMLSEYWECLKYCWHWTYVIDDKELKSFKQYLLIIQLDL